jgi:hypothetical protein
MAFVHGSSTVVLVNEKAVSSEVSGWGVTHQRAVSETTTVGQTAGAAGARFIPGLMSGMLTLRGPQDDDETAGLTKEITDAIGVDNAFLATCLPDGVAIGKPAFFCVGDPTEWAINAAVADAVGYTFSAAADESVEMGYVVHALAAETADGNGTAVDRGASPLTPTTRGLVAAIHVTAYSGLTSAAIKVQHSPDNSAWSDLVAFTSVTAIGSERKLVATGTTVNRYLRVVTDVTGTGSVTFLVSAAPR